MGYTETGKINSIVKVFDDAYRSTEACIIIDNIERLIEYVDIGPRFSNPLLQTLLILIKRLPSKSNCRLLLIGKGFWLILRHDELGEPVEAAGVDEGVQFDFEGAGNFHT